MWRFPPVRQTINNIFWKDEHPEYVISKTVDNELGLKKGKTVRFTKVEKFVDFFVEDAVPQLLYDLYRFCHNIKELKEVDAEEEELLEKVFCVNNIVELLKQKVLEIDNLQLCICGKDQDDFDLRINPTKTKISDAIEHFLEVNYDITVASSMKTSSVNRAVQARDLISYLPSEEHENVKSRIGGIDEPGSDQSDVAQNPISASKRHKCSEKHDEALDALAQDLANFHSFMNAVPEPDRDEQNPDTSTADAVDQNRLKKSTLVKAALFPVVGAVVGGAVGGPIGLMAGIKLGYVTSGVAMAGVTGTVIGYQSGKVLKNKRQNEEVAAQDKSN